MPFLFSQGQAITCRLPPGVLGVLCYVHVGLLAAGHLQQIPPRVDRFTWAIAQGKDLREAGQFLKAANAFQKAAEIAHASGNTIQQAQALQFKGGCEFRLFQYATALKTIGNAQKLASQAKDNDILGALSNNRAAIYSQLGDFQAAERAAEEAVQYLSHSQKKNYFISALITKGEIQFGINFPLHGTSKAAYSEGKAAFMQAIDIAQQAKLPELEANAADHLGIWLVLCNDLASAEALLNRAFLIRKARGDINSLAVSEEHLAELDLQKGPLFLNEALQHIDKALTAESPTLKTVPQYYPLNIRGRILLGLGQKDKALAEFRRAVSAADLWRQSTLPNDSTNIRTVAGLHGVYHDYAELAAELSLQRNNQSFAVEAFEALARNRAASLREQLTRSYSRESLLSPEYVALLQRLQAAQADVTLESNPDKNQENERKLAKIRAELNDLENRIGLENNFLRGTEINHYRNSLKSIQSKLGGNEALLSFSLGSRKSFLWTITNSELRLQELPNKEVIEKQANDFSQAIAGKWANRDSLGQAFSRSLFGNVATFAAEKPNWLLTVDGKLLDKIPFSAIPVSSLDGSRRPLGAVHTLRFLPSALLLSSPRAPKTSDRFVGVADPIYNRADKRVEHAPGTRMPRSLQGRASLARLVGSEREIQSSAKASGLLQTELLTGKKASEMELRRALATSPEILHFAVHVVSPKDRPGEAALALTLAENDLPELLTAESVATYRTPGSLVVLSGCASQQGEVLPSAGLIGLSRAWLLAGASAVIVSAWPTPDDSGQFFSKFYDHFRKTSGPVSKRAAIALQQTQSDMQASRDYRSDASFWAAYSIISKE